MTTIRTYVLAAGAAVGLTLAMPAGAATINFDDLADNVLVTNQYADATFSSTGGNVIRTSAQNLGSSLPNFICTGFAGGGINCVGEVVVAFTAPVSGLSFVVVGDDDVGVNALVDVFDGNGLLATANIIGDGDTGTTYTVDLSAYSGVSGITIRNVTDDAGLGFDDFTFAATTATPEPASALLLGGGLLALALRRRR